MLIYCSANGGKGCFKQTHCGSTVNRGEDKSANGVQRNGRQKREQTPDHVLDGRWLNPCCRGVGNLLDEAGSQFIRRHQLEQRAARKKQATQSELSAGYSNLYGASLNPGRKRNLPSDCSQCI